VSIKGSVTDREVHGIDRMVRNIETGRFERASELKKGFSVASGLAELPNRARAPHSRSHYLEDHVGGRSGGKTQLVR
jgi:hypothetical protein